MAKAKITFKEYISDSQNYSMTNESEDHMVSIVHFDMEIGGKLFNDLSVEVRQPFGTRFESEEFEVGPVKPYPPETWNHAEFSKLVEEYCRSLVGPTGSGIQIENSSNIRMRDNRFQFPKVVELDIPDGQGAGW